MDMTDVADVTDEKDIRNISHVGDIFFSSRSSEGRLARVTVYLLPAGG